MSQNKTKTILILFGLIVKCLIGKTDQDATILTSGQYGYQLEKQTKQDILIFSERRQNHFDLFTNNVLIISIAIMSLNQQDIQNEFIKLLTPPQRRTVEYKHSKYHVRIQFLVVIEKLKKNKTPKAKKIWFLFKINQIQARKLKLTKQNFQLFEKLIYLYARQVIFSTFNQQFADHNFQQITNIILCLYKGFEEHQKHHNQFQILQRVISFFEEDIFKQVMRNLNQSKDQGTSFFWNINEKYVKLLYDHQFIFISKYGARIFFWQFYGVLNYIILYQEIPHQCFKLQQYHPKYPIEEEEILFPLFEFIVYT
ncbi:unnamed protein product [Paramecium octaurelia]|uniref:Transmembrane protein n=1 Tax=Paramecium octaurelia TaxID=43137 RepID=A0A8S1VA69_PAROT|nr:unnamed protein product [Paramecium octaurelia]